MYIIVKTIIVNLIGEEGRIMDAIMKKMEFGKLDMYGTLTTNEIDNFDEFMKISNHEINAATVDISKAVNVVLDDMRESFGLKG